MAWVDACGLVGKSSLTNSCMTLCITSASSTALLAGRPLPSPLLFAVVALIPRGSDLDLVLVLGCVVSPTTPAAFAFAASVLPPRLAERRPAEPPWLG